MMHIPAFAHQPGRLNLELQALDVLLRPGVDWVTPTGQMGLLGIHFHSVKDGDWLVDSNTAGRTQSGHPPFPFPVPKRTATILRFFTFLTLLQVWQVTASFPIPCGGLFLALGWVRLLIICCRCCDCRH